MMTKKWLYLSTIMIGTLSMAETFNDADLDGVPDRLDHCPHTPFLHEVDSQGCTTKILKLPQESDTTNLTLSLGYGYNTNEDVVGAERQNVSKAQLSYYHDSWSYTLKTGYFSHHQASGMQDTFFKVKKRFKLTPALNLTLGAGVKLPSYDFQGNKTDYTLYHALNYYPSTSLSYFLGANYTFVNDTDSVPLQNSYVFYLGSGYFFTNHFYANLSYNYNQGKYRQEETYHTLSSTLYYKINNTFFTTLTYQRAIGDDDLHDGLIVKVGYKL